MKQPNWLSIAVTGAFEAKVENGELRRKDIDNLLLMWEMVGKKQGEKLEFSLENLAKFGRQSRPEFTKKNEPEHIMESIIRLLNITLTNIVDASPRKKRRWMVNPLTGFVRANGIGDLVISSYIDFPHLISKYDYMWEMNAGVLYDKELEGDEINETN